MKKVFALSLLLFAGAASASHAGVNFSINLGGGYHHGYYRPSYYCAPPVVYYAPPVVYYEPEPVYYVPEPAYYAYPPPVVHYRSGGSRIVYRHGYYR